MIREIATRKSTIGYKGLLLIIAITVLVILMSSLAGYIENTFGINFLEYLIYIMLIAFGFFVVKYFVTQYRYSLFDDQLIIEYMLGKKIKIIVDIFISDIVSFDIADKKRDIKKKKIKTFNLSVQNSNKYSIIYKKNKELFQFFFNPSEEFLQQLNRAIDQRKKKQHREPDIIT